MPALQSVEARTVIDRQPITSLLVVIHNKMAIKSLESPPLSED